MKAAMTTRWSAGGAATHVFPRVIVACSLNPCSDLASDIGFGFPGCHLPLSCLALPPPSPRKRCHRFSSRSPPSLHHPAEECVHSHRWGRRWCRSDGGVDWRWGWVPLGEHGDVVATAAASWSAHTSTTKSGVSAVVHTTAAERAAALCVPNRPLATTCSGAGAEESTAPTSMAATAAAHPGVHPQQCGRACAPHSPHAASSGAAPLHECATARARIPPVCHAWRALAGSTRRQTSVQV